MVPRHLFENRERKAMPPGGVFVGFHGLLNMLPEIGIEYPGVGRIRLL